MQILLIKLFIIVEKRRRRASTDDFLVVATDNLYTRHGSVIGIYFSPYEFPLSVIGQVPSDLGIYSVCRQNGTRIGTVPINCTSNIVRDLVIFAQAHISEYTRLNPCLLHYSYSVFLQFIKNVFLS